MNTRNCIVRIFLLGLSLAGITSACHADPGMYQHVLRSTAWIVNTKENVFGSGVLLDLDRRLIMTNRHVVGNANEVTVFFSAYDQSGQLLTDSKTYVANYETLKAAGIAMRGRVVALWKDKDLALVQLDTLPVEAQALPLAAESVQTGENVYSIGNSGAITQRCLWRYTRGVVRNNYRCPNAHVCYLETDSPVNHGDSGGPMVNDNGELVGIVTQFRTDATLVSQAIELKELRSMLQWYVGDTAENEMTRSQEN